jgi:excisionase family DNA binding protein
MAVPLLSPEAEMTYGADGSRLLTVRDLATVLNVSVAWVRKAILERSIPYTKIGRNVRFTPEQVVQIVESGKRPQLHQPSAGTIARGSARTKL